MAQKYTDPQTFLKNLVVKKGKSDLLGVYLTGVTVLADAVNDYGYDYSQEWVAKNVETLQRKEEASWNKLLVETRKNTDDIVHTLTFSRLDESITMYFIVEGHEMSAMVFIPTLLVNEFVSEIAFYNQLLTEVAAFAGKTPTSVKFTLGAALMDWDDLVEQGCAREVDVGF